MRSPIIAVALITMLVLVGLLSATAVVGEDAPDKSTDERIADFQAERMKTVQQIVEASEAMYRAGQVDMTQLMAARSDLVEARLEMASTQAERLALLEEHRDQARFGEQLAETRFRDGRGNQIDCLQAKAVRLKREIALLRETDH